MFYQGDASTYYGSFADTHTLNQYRTCANEDSIADLYRAAQDGPRGDVDIGANFAIVIHTGPSVNRDINTQCTPWLHDGAGHDLGAVRGQYVRGHPGVRMHQRRKRVSLGTSSSIDASTYVTSCQLPYTQSQVYLRRLITC